MEKSNDSIITCEKRNPNTKYSILYVSSGPENCLLSELGEELITDGEISDMVHNYNETSEIYRRGSAVVKIKHASYTIIQRIADNNVINAEVLTMLEEDDKIDRIMELANERQTNNGEFLITKCPYVRKIKL